MGPYAKGSARPPGRLNAPSAPAAPPRSGPPVSSPACLHPRLTAASRRCRLPSHVCRHPRPQPAVTPLHTTLHTHPSHHIRKGSRCCSSRLGDDDGRVRRLETGGTALHASPSSPIPGRGVVAPLSSHTCTPTHSTTSTYVKEQVTPGGRPRPRFGIQASEAPLRSTVDGLTPSQGGNAESRPKPQGLEPFEEKPMPTSHHGPRARLVPNQPGQPRIARHSPDA